MKVPMGGDALNEINSLDYSGGLTNHGAAIDMYQTTFSGGAGVTPFILSITDGLATSADGSLIRWLDPLKAEQGYPSPRLLEHKLRPCSSILPHKHLLW